MDVFYKLIIMISYLTLLAIYFLGVIILARVVRFALSGQFGIPLSLQPNYVMCAHETMT